MYLYLTKREETLVFSDLFGLTRVRMAKKQVKTDKKERSSFLFGTLSCDESESLLYTWRDTWNKATLWALPLIKSVKRFPRFERSDGVLHPNGSWIVFPRGFELSFDFYSGSAPPTVVDLTPSTGAPEKLYFLKVPAPLRFGEQRRFAFFCDGVLQEGTVDEDRVEVHTVRTLAIPSFGRVELFLEGEDTWVVHDQFGESTLYGPGGEIEQRSSISPLQIVAGKAIYQPDETHVVREDLVSKEQERFELAEEDQGFAQVLAGPGRLLILPWHREEVVDLESGDRISRKLPAADLATRRDLMREAQKLLRAAMLVGAFVDWSDFLVNKTFPTYSHTAQICAHPTFESSLFGNLAYPFWRGKEMGGRTIGSHGAIGGGVSMRGEMTWSEEEAIPFLKRFMALGLSKKELLRELAIFNVGLVERVPRSIFDWLKQIESD